MFETFNLENFGKYLKSIRIGLSYTQKQVEELSGISIDTLRRIETGKVLLRYDTLVYLSHVYKKDLLNDLRSYGNSSELFQYYSRIDDLILKYDTDTLKNLSTDFSNFAMNNNHDQLINVAVQEQFELFIRAISEYNLDNNESAKIYCIEALKKTNKTLTFETICSFNYTHFEQRILLLLALVIADMDKYEESNLILNFCLEHSNFEIHANMNEKMIITKIYANLSYNSHIADDNINALEYANKGIEFCIKNNINYAFPVLLYRKGIAEFILEMPDYLSSLKRTISFLLATDNKKLAEIYANVTQEKYGIHIDIANM